MNYKDDKYSIRTVPNDPEDDIVKQKVLFACINAPTYSPAGMIEGFRRCGYEVIAFDWQHIRFELGIEDMQERLIVKAITEKPELIFLHMQNADALDIETAKKLSEYGFVISFSEDVRTDLSWYEEIAPHIGLTVFTNIDDVEKLKAKGLRAAYIPTSYNHLIYKPQPKTEKNYGEIIFIGNRYTNTNLNFPQAQERQDMVEFMQKEFGERFQAYGLGQKNKMLNANEAAEAYNNCKVAITHSNFKRKGYCSDRNFNSMGCGTITIQQYFDGVEKLFKGTSYLFTWGSLIELRGKCEILLGVDLSTSFIRNSIAPYIQENHQWYNRILKLKDIIKQYA